MEPVNKDNWIEFVNSYIGLVELACKEVDNINYSHINTRIAIIYNIKHAIELFLKCIIRLVDENNEAKIISHNLPHVFKQLEEKIKLKKFIFKEGQEELRDYIKQEKKEWKNGSYSTIILSIVEYYNKLEFIDNKQAKVEDIKNTFFRYPEDENGLEHEINYFDFIYNNKFDAEKVLEDTMTLSLCLHSIKTILM